MGVRTDLALERAEIEKKNIKGITIEEEKIGNTTVSRMRILDREAEERLKKPIGSYITLSVPRFTKNAGLDRKAVGCLAKELKRLLPEKLNSVLVAGLGNESITPDS